MTEQKHEFEFAKINLPKDLASKIYNWTKSFIKSDVEADHVTVLYGFHKNSFQQAREVISNFPKFEITLKNTSVFSNEKDVLIIKVESQELIELNSLLHKSCNVTTDYEYSPHLTLSYMPVGTAKKYKNLNNFNGTKISVNSIFYKKLNGTIEEIQLK